jgi:hypothetical protein
LSSRLSSAVVLALALAGSSPALAQTPAPAPPPATNPADTPSIKVGATLFADYTYTFEPRLTDAAGDVINPSAFNVTRAYFNVTGNVNHWIRFRITPDIVREVSSGLSVSGSLVYRLKYALVQFGLDDWSGTWKNTWVRLGMQPTPYTEWIGPIYRYRFQGQPFAQRDGLFFSSDNGVSAHTNLPNDYGDVQAGIFNGEGYLRPETNDQKAIQVRGTLRPLPHATGPLKGLRVGYYYHGDHYVHDAERRKTVTTVVFEHPHLNAGFDYLTTADRLLPTLPRIDGAGYSVFVTPFFKHKGEGPEALVRFDDFSPDETIDPHRHRFIVGAAYWFPHASGAATTVLMLDYEQVHFATIEAPQRKLAVHAMVDF